MLVHIDSINNKSRPDIYPSPQIGTLPLAKLNGSSCIGKARECILIFGPAASAPHDALGTQLAPDEAGR